MKIYVKNNSYHYETENLVRIFFPNDKLETIFQETTDYDLPCVISEVLNSNSEYDLVTATVMFNDFTKTLSQPALKNIDNYDEECERILAELLFNLLKEYTGINPPWGILTGVRPIKLFRKFSENIGVEATKKHFTDKFLVTTEKTELALETEINEQKVLKLSTDKSFSLYISIPFCPSRCSYCSFVSQSVERAKRLIEPYLDLLCKEIEQTAEISKQLDLKLETVYIGGGTPTTLSAEQLTKLITVINNSFNMNQCKEFTVEAGRPDTITEAKLKAILNGGVNRISINPQTLNDEVLKAIGRRHTAQQAIDAFYLARKVGFSHINMDLIAGLPNDTYESFKNTLSNILKLNPESITVHTLSMKKSSYLTEQGMTLYKKDAIAACKMHSLCRKELSKKDYHPYYLYRQSRMVGNLENIGYAKPDNFGLYNVFVMDETHTVFGCGAGAVTKLKSCQTNYLERIFNYKYPYEYIDKFDEMLKRKEAIIPFYRANFDFY